MSSVFWLRFSNWEPWAVPNSIWDKLLLVRSNSCRRHMNEAQLKEKFPHYWHLRVELIEKIEVALGKTSQQQAAYKKTELNLPNLHLFSQFPPIMAKWVAVYNGLSLNLRNPNHPKMVQHQLYTCPLKHHCLAVQKVIHFLWQLAHGGPH